MPVRNTDPISQQSPYPTNLLEETPWRHFFHKNGYEKLSRSLTLQHFSSYEKAHQLWELFSPNQSIFDLWEIRDAFYQGYKFPATIVTLKSSRSKKEEFLGALPLWFTTDREVDIPDSPPSRYTWLASNWPEDNRFFVKDPEYIPLLLAAAPAPIILACIKPLPEYDLLHTFSGYKTEKEKKFFLDLTNIKTIDDYLIKLKKKKRYNLRRDRKHIQKLNPKIIINDPTHVEEMFQLSIRRFREKYPDNPDEYSAFEDNRRKNVFRNLLTNAKRYQYRLISTIIKGSIEAVEFGLVYGNTYYAFNAGTDISRYPGIGVFSNLLVIEDAIKLGCTKVDFLEGDNNWKESWNLDFIYQFQFTK